MLKALLDQFRRGDRRALARLLSVAARGEGLGEILPAIGKPARPARVVAVTGSAGVGKSTLIGKLIEQLRGRNQTVAVLACDPQSPVSGGALLGDRFRMPARSNDDGVFIRSLAAVSGRGAVAEHLDALVRLLESFGFDVILIETVGAGQGDTAVHDLADVVVLLLQPETGDDLQWEKAGLLEVADIITIHKADLPRADHVEAQVRATLGLSGQPTVPVLRVSSKTGEGVEALTATLVDFPLRRDVPQDGGHALLRRAQERLATWFAAAQTHQRAELDALVDQWRQGSLSDEQAVESLWELHKKDVNPGHP
jgi:LAO/AO transport system ATPase